MTVFKQDTGQRFSTARRVREWREWQKVNGLCVDCNEYAVRGTRCHKHADAHAAKMRERRRRK